MKIYFPSRFIAAFYVVLSTVSVATSQDEAPKPKSLRIIAFGAHPDDPEFQIGGCAIKWTKLGHKVKLVACTNGDIGHWEMSGGELAKRRTAEVQEAARRMGTEVEVLDIHDGELEQTLENRKTLVRLIREWDADLVFSHRPYDYHPDHRNVGLLVQDAAFMVMVPNFCPDTPRLTKNPAFFFFPDGFTKPYPFTPTLAVSIDDVMDEKVQAIDALESQVYEGGALGGPDTRAKRFGDDPVIRVRMLKKSWSNRHGRIAKKHRDSLIEWYGKEAGEAVEHAEAFELCEYGSKPSKEQLRILFPFFD
ncbi:PIG-L family deacetylase [Verrucomicrobiales bacterium]|nr:PIG-L family deacetylase [Verrucomicrobiales bacterium]MDB4358607.1 PIG-L family deacetylase [Verrucomicrobiales bacterium]